MDAGNTTILLSASMRKLIPVSENMMTAAIREKDDENMPVRLLKDMARRSRFMQIWEE